MQIKANKPGGGRGGGRGGRKGVGGRCDADTDKAEQLLGGRGGHNAQCGGSNSKSDTTRP